MDLLLAILPAETRLCASVRLLQDLGLLGHLLTGDSLTLEPDPGGMGFCASPGDDKCYPKIFASE